MTKTRPYASMLLALFSLVALGGLLLMSQAGAAAGADLLPRNAVWSYSDTGVDLGAAWRAPGFDDSAWKKGGAPLGFGDDYSETDPSLPLKTAVAFGDPANKWMCTYFRTTIDAPEAIGSLKEVEVYIHVDDGAVVYINGAEAFRRGIADGEAVVFSTVGKFKPKEETFRMKASLLKPGKNLIAVEVHQDGGDSSDLWFEMGIRAPELATAAAPSAPAAPVGMERGTISKVVITFWTDASTTRAFTWYSSLLSRRNDLQLVEKVGTAAPDFGKALKFNGYQAVSSTSRGEVFHKAEALGLKPGATYYFRVGDSTLDLWSETSSFTTAPKGEDFSFIDLADTQAKTEDEAKLSAATLAKAFATVKGASFMVLNGDIVDTGMVEKQWDWMLGHSAATLSKITFVPAAGNHEEDASSFFEHFDLPVPAGASTKGGAYYSYDYQHAHFIVLNTNEDSPEWADLSPAQVEWLKADVARAKKAGKAWIILTMHKGPYTTSNHATDADMTDPNGLRVKFAPLVAELGIDLVLQGHDHIYARSKPIVKGKVAAKGPVYVIPSTAGPKVYYKSKKIEPSFFDLFAVADEHHAAVYGPDPADSSRPVRGVVQNFLGISIKGKTLTLTAWEIDLRKDGGVPFIIDTYTIKK